LKIGIFPHEELKAQRVVVDVALYADPKTYLKSVNLDTIIDYGTVYNAIISWTERPQVQLIEDYLKELVTLCFEFASVEACQISIKKSDVFGPDQGAGVELYTSREDYNEHGF